MKSKFFTYGAKENELLIATDLWLLTERQPHTAIRSRRDQRSVEIYKKMNFRAVGTKPATFVMKSICYFHINSCKSQK